MDKAKELLGFEAKHAQPGQRERPRRARSPALARAGPHLPRLTCLEATRAPDMAGNLPPPPTTPSLCGARRHSIVDDAGWYFEQNYKAQGGTEKEVDFGLDEALTA